MQLGRALVLLRGRALCNPAALVMPRSGLAAPLSLAALSLSSPPHGAGALRSQGAAHAQALGPVISSYQAGAAAAAAGAKGLKGAAAEALAEKEQAIAELREMNEVGEEAAGPWRAGRG